METTVAGRNGMQAIRERMDRSAGLCSRNFIPQKAIAGELMVLLDCAVFRALQGFGGERVSL